jgi:dTDP-4-amino-4,6-dideoxygalactose transaminase
VLTGEYAGRQLGTFGDAAVFSWRKFLPVYDGAELVLNRRVRIEARPSRNESALFTLKAAMNLVDTTLSQSRGIIGRSARRVLRVGEAVVRRRARSYVATAAGALPESDSLSFDLATSAWQMSRLSQWMLTHSNIEKIVATRRRNYEHLLSELSAMRGVRPIFPKLPRAVCPWVLPVVFDGLAGAHFELRRRGIPAVAWDGVRHGRIPSQGFEDADFLYHNLVFLPIHQCLRAKDVAKIAAAARELVSK